MIEMWLVRDEDRCLYLFFGAKPYKYGNKWYSFDNHFIMLRKRSCPEVQWTDEEPTKVKLVIER